MRFVKAESDANEGKAIYVGQWCDGLMEGKGVLHYWNKMKEGKLSSPSSVDAIVIDEVEKYEGTFRRGKRSGHGCLYHPNGTLVKGHWQDDEPKDGSWTFEREDGSKYVGQAKWEVGHPSAKEVNGSEAEADKEHGNALAPALPMPHGFPIPNGKGTMTYANADVYIGTFVHGRREGHGVCTFENGHEWDGTWKNDKYEEGCEGVLTLSGGTVTKFSEELDKDNRE